MKLAGPLSRTLALAGLLIVTASAATPVYAAKADIDLLKTYIGAWKGRGTLVGADSESVVCRLTLSDGNGDKVNYSGRCSLAGQNLSVNGTLLYNDAGRRFEAAMTTNATFSGTAIGQRQGSGVVFNLREKEKDEEGNEMTITAAIILGSNKIGVDFQVIFNATGDMLKAQVPFTK